MIQGYECTRCGKWVCPEVCWNDKAGLCEACAPNEEEELAAQKAQATAEQIALKARQQDFTQDLDFKSKAGLNLCPGCGAKNQPKAKFCSACGEALPPAAPAAFCPECGFHDGTEAVAVYAQNHDQVKVVLTDMMMPYMDGAATIGALRRINPQVAIIAASGMMTQRKEVESMGGNIKVFLPKPFTAEQLLQVLQEVLAPK